ncbi:hypothetical protein AZE42_04324 [Rhizopogon vesiculosus]|uniref:Heterokaryon incompatibility domain-containing protein n=1 Tax=Rhizopogon vesiculosus TaxID=180088 RepID=A0A1J8Q2T0_9AGAM|nr:hypothetical protein AZE42_04324 [Rhizopogon vesiculosus]
MAHDLTKERGSQTELDSFHTGQSYIVDELPPGRVDEEQVKQVIRTIAELILRIIPVRLLNTRDGKIYTGAALKKKFEESDKFRSLLVLITTESTLEQKLFIREVVRNFFAYVMLSHRWEDDELAFENLKGASVYDLPTSRFHKVRGFCRQAARWGFDWAWVDTCCIDQKSSSDVQESISTMFSWYRKSALTIIYLSDVTTSSIQALLRSQWFRRGWTLQELLAAKVIQLYKKDWSPFYPHAPFNHKDVPEILDALQSATGIEKKYLKDYLPSVECPRMKLTWARHRATKKKEDEAYCLIGIFGLTMSVRYGEGDKAFSRLLVQIMRHADDATLLDWVGQPSSMNSCLPSSPRYFMDVPFKMLHAVPEAHHHSAMSFPFAAKLVYVLKGATRRARNSSHVHRDNNANQEPRGDETSAAIQAPQIMRRRSSQSPLAQLLENPPRPYILTAEIHITVPCFVHEVQSLFFERGTNSYVCHANGIQQFSLFTSEDLRICVIGHHSPSGYLLVRPWDPRLCHALNTYHSGLSLLRQRLATPFFAMLLERSNRGRFRRIPTDRRIVARLESLPSLTYEVRLLDLQ